MMTLKLKFAGLVLVAWMALTAAAYLSPKILLAAYSSPAQQYGDSHTAVDEGALINALLSSHALGRGHEIPASLMTRVLGDADNRISSEFKVPEQIRNNVEFWFKIYTQYSTRNLVFFDTTHPEIIYEALDFNDLAATARNRVVYEVVSKKIANARISAYKAAFARLEKNPRPKNPTREEALILAAVKKLPHKHSFAELSKTFRTQTGQRDNVINGIATAEDFMEKMETIFGAFNLPKELVRLSLVESSFNVGVTSRVGAAGVWQFMPNSAKEYLFVHPESRIDERLSPIKSTVAAAKMIQRNRRLLGNWALVITSYNHGIRNLRRHATYAKDDFKSVAHLFQTCGKARNGIGWASRNYYPEFIAMVHAEAYREELFSDLRKPHSPTLTFTELREPMTLASFAMNRSISLKQMVELNPDVRDFRARLPRGYLLAIPSDKNELDLLIRRSRFVDPPRLVGSALTGGLAARKPGNR